MAEKKRPDAWVGEMVAITLSVRKPEEFIARLEEVNDRGVVLILAPDRAGAPVAFYPWSAVRRLRLMARDEDEVSWADTRSGDRLPGDPGWFT